MSQGGIKIGRLMKDEGKINPTFIKKNPPNDFIAVFTTYVNVRKIKKAQKGPYEKQSAIIFVVFTYKCQLSNLIKWVLYFLRLIEVTAQSIT